MKKNVTALLLGLVMTVSVMTGCGNDNEVSNGTEITTSETKNAEAETASKPTEVAKEDDSLYPLVDEPTTIKILYVSTFDFSKGRIVWDKVSEITGLEFEWTILDAESLPVYLSGGDWDFYFIHYRYLDATPINDYGVTGAIGLFQSVIGFVLVVSVNTITKKLDSDSALF